LIEVSGEDSPASPGKFQSPKRNRKKEIEKRKEKIEKKKEKTTQRDNPGRLFCWRAVLCFGTCSFCPEQAEIVNKEEK
jgi:hypothetical protein